MSDWWNFCLESHGDVSPEFMNEWTEALNSKTNSGSNLVTAEIFHSCSGLIDKWRGQLKHDLHPMTLEQMQSIWLKVNLPVEGIDMLTATRLAWMFCNDG